MAQRVLVPPAPVRRRSRTVLLVLVALAVLSAAAGAVVLLVVRSTGERVIASATLTLPDGRSAGRVDFLQGRPGTVVRARVELPAGVAGRSAFHGFHVHANDDATNGNGCVADPAGSSKNWFVSADAHLDHGGHRHPQHAGDMPSIYVAADGRGWSEFRTDGLSAAGLTGRAVVLHAGPDNFGRVPVGTTAQDYTPNGPDATKATQQGGNSGDRVACGLVGPPVTD